MRAFRRRVCVSTPLAAAGAVSVSAVCAGALALAAAAAVPPTAPAGGSADGAVSDASAPGGSAEFLPASAIQPAASTHRQISRAPQNADRHAHAHDRPRGNVDFPRFPAISPDGDTVVFSWRGDLWSIDVSDPSKDLQATRLTAHPRDELRSAFSPDGSTIAFHSTRDGYGNVWLMNADGSDIRQVTRSDRSLTPTGFSHDGSRVLGHASREGDVYRALRPYAVSVDGGAIERLHDAFGNFPTMSPDGTRIAFERGGSDWDRRHYRGPDDRDVWIYSTNGDGGDDFTPLTEWEGNDGVPKWRDDNTILYMTDRELDTVNLWEMQVDGRRAGERRARRLTDFEGADVRSFDVSRDGRTGVLMVWDTLYLLDLTKAGAEPMPLTINATEDFRDNFELNDITRDVSEAALSPDEQVMAFVAYGEVFVRNVEDNSPTRRVTESHAHERNIVWSPDGTKLYFQSDRDGTDGIYSATVSLTRSELEDRFREATGMNEDEDDAQTEDDTADDDADSSNDDADSDDDAPKSPQHPLVGTWSAESTGARALGAEDDVAAFTMTFALEGDELVGSVGSEQGTIDMEDLAFDAESGDLRFTIDMQGAVIELTGNYMDGLLSGDWSAPQVGAAGTWSATMTQPAEPAADDEDEADADEASDADEPNPAKRWHDAMRFDIHDEVVTTHNDRDPTPSPDGKHLSFRRGLGDLIILDLASGDEHALVQWWDRSLDWRWSPCSNYIAYAVQDDDFNADIFIARADGSDGVYRRHNGSKEHAGVNVTMHPDSDWSPRWSADGKILAFISERSDEEYDVYRVYLDKDLEALRGKQLEDYYDQAVADAKKRKPIDPVTFDDDADDENGEGDAEADASADDIPQLDLDDAYLRLTRITNFPGSEFGLELTPGGDRFIFTGTDGSRQLLSVDWRGGSKKSLGSPASVQHISLDGSKLVLVSGGQGQTMSSSGGSRDTVSIDHTLRIDLQQQNAQKFREAARELGEAFYHPTMKGLDWEHLTEAYGRLAEQTRTSNEFADVANRLLGELNGSHLAIRPPGDVGAQAQSNGRLGIDATRLESGAYRVDRVLDQGPAASGDMKLEAGDIITAVEFETITPETTLEEMLKGRVGEETVVTIRRRLPHDAEGDQNGGDAGFKDVVVDVLLTPTSYGGERNLRYLDWTERRRAKVEELSDGRLGYLHIRAMSQASLEDFERDLFAAAYGKDGLIVDVRNNGGGWTADRVMASLTVQRHAYTVPRGADPSYTDGYPQDRLFIQRYLKPVNMMCNEKSFSNAEIVSHAFKTTGRGTLVGQQTYGGVISTGGFSLIDGTFVRMPFRGWYVLDGTDMENNGAMPDILIPQTPEHETMQYDAQLEAAVNDLLRRI